MKTIRTKMTMLFGILMTGVCLGLMAASFVTSERTLIDTTQKSMESLAVQAGKAVDAKLSNYLNALDALSYCGVFGNTENAQEAGPDIMQALSSEAKRGGYLHMAYIDGNGTAFFEDGSHSDLKEGDYYRRAMLGESVVTEPLLSENYGLIMIYAVPVHSGDQITGVLLGIRDGFELGALAGESANGDTGSAFIINKQGNTIAHSDKEMMQTVLDSFFISEDASAGEGADLASSATRQADAVSSATQQIDTAASETPGAENQGENLLGYTNFDKLQQAMIEGKTGYGEYEFGGIEKIMGYAPIGSLDWSIGLEKHRTEALKGISTLIRNLVIIGLLFLIAALGIVYFAARQMSKPIEHLTGICHLMSVGDYTMEPKESYGRRRDEIGRLAVAFQAITASTKELLQENAEISKTITVSSQDLDRMIQKYTNMMKEVSAAIEQIAAGNLEQAESTQREAQHVGEMEKLIEQEYQNMGGLRNSSNRVEQLKEEGFAILKELVKETEENSSLSGEIYQAFQETSQSTGRVTDISGMIGNITKQTKLLALNASIEAARAGESGKGFSVVAKEVERLAESADSLSREISTVVEDIGSKTLSSMEKLEQVTGAIMRQAKSVKTTQSKFLGIAEAIEETKSNINTMNLSLQEMNDKKTEVVKIITDLSATSEENASGTQEVSALVHEQSSYMDQIANLSRLLADMAGELDEYIGKYKF